jgi:hypothetical protein
MHFHRDRAELERALTEALGDEAQAAAIRWDQAWVAVQYY